MPIVQRISTNSTFQAVTYRYCLMRGLYSTVISSLRYTLKARQ